MVYAFVRPFVGKKAFLENRSTNWRQINDILTYIRTEINSKIIKKIKAKFFHSHLKFLTINKIMITRIALVRVIHLCRNC